MSRENFQTETKNTPFEPPVSYETAMAKADSIIQLMSLEEKIDMIGGHNIFFTKGYEKYGIPAIRFSDATQGISLVDFKDHLEKSVAFPALAVMGPFERLWRRQPLPFLELLGRTP